MNRSAFGYLLMRFRFSLLVVLVLLLGTSTAQAEEYMDPSWPNLMRTMVRFNALDLSDAALLDEYTIITECNLYKAFYRDDFKWHQVHDAMLKSVQMNLPTFPTAYHYDVNLQFDRYDFNAGVYRLTEKTTLSNVNTFVFYSVTGTSCGTADVKFMPRIFRAVLSAPFYLDGLPLSQTDAQALLKQMESDKNTDHIVYARFNLRVVYIEPLRKEKKADQDIMTHYVQSDSLGAGIVRFDVRLESVNFYEDPENTKLIYQFQP